MSSGKRLFIHTYPSGDLVRLPGPTAFDRSIHDPPAGMPVQIQQTTYAFDTALPLKIKDQRFELIGHVGVVFPQPRDNLQNAMLRTFNPRELYVDKGGHLENIQMPELPFPCVVIDRAQPLAFGTRKGKIARMANVNIHPLFSLVEHDLEIGRAHV